MLHYQQPHLVRPLLSVAWHQQTRRDLSAVAIIAAIFNVEIHVRVGEKKDGDLLASASMPDDVTNVFQSFVSRVCAAASEAVPFICVICGAVCSCTQRFHNGGSR